MKLRIFLVAACVMMLPVAMSTAQAADPGAARAASPSIIAHAASLPGAQPLTVAEMAETRGMVTAPTPELNLTAVITPIDIPTTQPFNLGIDTLLDPIFVVMPID